LEYEDMTADRENPTPSSGDRGVFGNLPSERPGVRSPRRGEGKGAKAKASQPKSPKAAPATGRAVKPAPKAARKSPPPRPAHEQAPPRPPPETESSDPGSGRGSVEEVAWAGITVAAEAATLGVRLVSRALEAVRERR
jgi:hypothetical protein